MPHDDVNHAPVMLPGRVHDRAYRRGKIAPEIYVPELF
jgi:hypothetical protein